MIEKGRRYPELEQDFIKLAIGYSGLVTNGRTVEANEIFHRIVERLAKGAEEYGPAQFWVPNLIPEIEEECDDIVGWSALESVKMRERGEARHIPQLAGAAAGAIRIRNTLAAIERSMKAT